MPDPAVEALKFTDSKIEAIFTDGKKISVLEGEFALAPELKQNLEGLRRLFGEEITYARVTSKKDFGWWYDDMKVPTTVKYKLESLAEKIIKLLK